MAFYRVLRVATTVVAWLASSVELKTTKFEALSLSQSVCALDDPSLRQEGLSKVVCASRCALLPGCDRFNYRTNRICELFLFSPKCYQYSTNCAHYQSKYYLPNYLQTGIAAENCSFPFTKEGQLFLMCTRNFSTSCNVGCLVAKRQWRTCVQSTDYEAKYVTVNVTIPGFSGGSIPLVSIHSWIIIQQRVDGSVNFSRNWNEYKTGFGNIATNFWLGLEMMYRMTSSATTNLRIEIQSSDNSNWFSTEYDTFLVDPEVKGYALHVTGYSGDSGDGVNGPINGASLNGMKFTTFDKDNDLSAQVNCAAFIGGGGFWFNNCCYMNLNQPYGTDYFYWHHLTDLKLAATMQLKTSRMMVRGV